MKQKSFLVAATTLGFVLWPDAGGCELPAFKHVHVNQALITSARYLAEQPSLFHFSKSFKGYNARWNYGTQPVAPANTFAFANSPRYIKTHPELTRFPSSILEARAKADQIGKQMLRFRKNSSWAAGPRAGAKYHASLGVQSLKAST